MTQAESEYEVVEQAIPKLQLALRTQENALRVLSGELPGPVTRSAALVDAPLPTVPATLPSDLLRRRPDIASAELALATADATLGSGHAAFMPQVGLSVTLGRLSVSSLDYDPLTVWSFGGSVLAPIFDGKRLAAQFEASAARRDQAAFAYRGAVLAAFQEVETALSSVARYAEQVARLQKRSAIRQRSDTLASDRYQTGYAAYLEQLDAQRGLYSTELEAITVRQNQLNNIVTLYQALGGGWRADDATGSGHRR